MYGTPLLDGITQLEVRYPTGGPVVTSYLRSTLYAVRYRLRRCQVILRSARCRVLRRQWSNPNPPTMTNTPCPTTFTPMYHILRRPSVPRL